MPSLGSLLSIGKTAIHTNQKAMNVVAHNIANASTPGYSRQKALLNGSPAVTTAQGVFGTGVTIENVQQYHDELLDRTLYRELGSASEHETRSNILSRIEGIMGEPSDTGLAAAMDAFHSAWSDLGANPVSSTTRTALRQSATVLSQKFQSFAANLDVVRQDVDTRLLLGADSVNRLASDIAELNLHIVAAETGGITAGDLRDSRSRALTELASLLPIQISERADGSMGVTASGFGLVDGATSTTIEIRTTAGVTGVAIPGRAGLFPDEGGTIGGLLEVLNSDYPDVRTRLDSLAANLVAEVNTLHQTGTGPGGNTGVDFFDAAGVTASSIGLSSAVLGSIDEIAAGTPDGVGAYRAGANDVATSLAGLRDTTVGALGMSLSEHYEGLVSDVGHIVRSSSDAGAAQRVLADQAEIRRMSYTGVSVDEELVSLIEFQTAYQAAARVLTTADEMIQSLLAI